MRDTTVQTVPVDLAAELLGISRASVYKAVRQGELPAIRIGGRVLVLRSGLERLLGDEMPLAEVGRDER